MEQRGDAVYKLSEFFGFTCYMILDKPYIYFHVDPEDGTQYDGYVNIKTGQLVEGYLPDRLLGLAVEWLMLHHSDLSLMWWTKKYKKVPPLF